jgi:hypothetical protein
MPSMTWLVGLLGQAAPIGIGVRAALRWASAHTGLPVVIVAAIALVASWRIFRHSIRLIVEIAIATAILLVASAWGLIHW